MMRLLFSAMVILSTGSLLASNHPSPGKFGVTAEYPFLKPTVDDTYFVTESPRTTTFPNGKRNNNCFDFHSGYRVGGAYAFCNCDREAVVTYTNLRTQEEKTVNGNFLWATLGRPDFASSFENYAGSAASRVNFKYQRVDGFVSQKIYDCCGLDIRFQFGVEYALLHFNEHYTYQTTNTVGKISQNSRTWGVGPEFGIGFDYELFRFCGCLPETTISLTGLSTGSLLTGQTGTRTGNVLNNESSLSVSDEKEWRIIPALHAKVGINYSTCVRCLKTSIEVGYEYNSYYRGLARSIYEDDVADALCTTNYYNFDTQGLYVSASVSF